MSIFASEVIYKVEDSYVFLIFLADNAFRRRVDDEDSIVRVSHDDAVFHTLHHRGELFPAQLSRLLVET